MEHRIKFGIRCSFNFLEDFESRFRNITEPIELALPHRMDEYMKIRAHLDELANKIKDRGIKVLSVHAPQGHITDSFFLTWGYEAGRFADTVGAENVTVHPNSVARDTSRQTAQEIALRYLRMVQRRCKARIAIKTFEGNRRVFRPQDIIQLKLPMVLDVAHLFFHEEVLKIIHNYHQNISMVHLSARSDNKSHLPIDDFCIEVVNLLISYGWEGSVILEYLPCYHYKLKEDCQFLREWFQNL